MLRVADPEPSSFTRRETSRHVKRRHVTSQMTFALFSPEKSFWVPILNVAKHLETSKLAALTATAAEV